MYSIQVFELPLGDGYFFLYKVWTWALESKFRQSFANNLKIFFIRGYACYFFKIIFFEFQDFIKYFK